MSQESFKDSDKLRLKILEFYPTFIALDKHRIEGNISIELPDYPVDLRNIQIYLKNKKYWQVKLPFMVVKSHKEIGKARVPCIHFKQEGIWQKIITEIQAQIEDFISEWLVTEENPVRDFFYQNRELWPEKQINHKKRPFKKKIIGRNDASRNNKFSPKN